MIYTNINGYDVATKGNVVINETLHRVYNKYVYCNNSLNGKAWNVTEEKNKCKICFPDAQIDMFNN